VRFTTHAMVESRCKGWKFAEVGAFHYRGKPRSVRIWDEAILAGHTLTIRATIWPRSYRLSWAVIPY
jgi:hypothetical protein